MQPAPMESDGTGLRNGFAASVGYLSGQQLMIDRAGMMFGVDWRIGAQITSPGVDPVALIDSLMPPQRQV